MLLTLKPLSQHGTIDPHEYSISQKSVSSRRTPWTTVGGTSATFASSLRRPHHLVPGMDNHPRRELPIPSAMSRPAEPSIPAVSPPSQLPTLDPAYYSEDSIRQWLRTRAEEDRRRQEEERTRQESLKLEQRRIEQSMLRDAFQGGVPPQMVPLIFVGLGGKSLNMQTDVAQQIDSSIQQAQSWQQPYRAHTAQQQPLPTQVPSRLPPPGSETSQSLPADIRRDNNRAIPPNPYASQPAPPRTSSPPQPTPPSPTQTQLYRGSLQPARLHSFGDAQSNSSMPRLNTTEIQFSHSSHNVGPAQPQPGLGSTYVPGVPTSAPPPAPTRPETQANQSPSIYFHHWVPPSQSQPSTPSTRGRQESASRPHAQGETHTSPGRKRKAVGSHPPPPPPPAPQQEQYSPAFSQVSPRRGSTTRIAHGASHLRGQSDLSHGSRQEHSESDSDNFSRFRPGRESILNPMQPMQPTSRRRSSEAAAGQHPGR